MARTQRTFDVPPGSTMVRVELDRTGWTGDRVSDRTFENAIHVECSYTLRGQTVRAFFKADAGESRNRAGAVAPASSITIPLKGEPGTLQVFADCELPLEMRLRAVFS